MHRVALGASAVRNGVCDVPNVQSNVKRNIANCQRSSDKHLKLIFTTGHAASPTECRYWDVTTEIRRRREQNASARSSKLSGARAK